MELRNANPFELSPNPWNSNKVDRVNFEKLKKSLSTLGTFKPVIVREKDDGYEILGGFHRVEAAKELGFEEVPILDLGKLSDQKAKEISLIDNARYGQDDSELLEKLINSMDTEFISLAIPETEELAMPELSDDFSTDFENSVSDSARNEDNKTLKFRFEDLDKADEVEDKLLVIAKNNSYFFIDGYPDLAKALYHALVLDNKND